MQSKDIVCLPSRSSTSVALRLKLSVSLPDEDVAILDEFARAAGLPSRSAALHHAVRMLRLPDLEQDYEAAWREWEESGDQATWGVTAGDGVADVAR